LPDLIITAIADAINFQLYSGSEPKDQLSRLFCVTKTLLLVLDNFEHLLGWSTPAERRSVCSAWGQTPDHFARAF